MITKTSLEEIFLAGNSFPFYDRSVITDSKGLYNIYLSEMENIHERFKTKNNILPHPSNSFRGSFIIRKAEIQRLKKLASLRRTNLAHPSSFIVVCAYVWSCLAKVHTACGEDTHEDELEHFGCAVNSRSHLNPLVLDNYFGNCFVPCVVTIESTRLIDEDGFLFGVELIGEAISKIVNSEGGLLKGTETWIVDREAKNGQ